MLTLTVEHNCICFLNIQEFTATICFGPICGPSSGCGWPTYRAETCRCCKLPYI